MFLLLSLQAMTPPPIIVSSSVPRVSAARASAETLTVDVDATAGSEVLWRGSLRVGSSSRSASFNRTTMQAPRPDCDTAKYDEGVRDSFNLSLNRYPRGDGPIRTTVQVSWDRPSGCSGDRVQRSVQLSGALDLQPGQPVTIEGDAGLRIRFTLR
jgi:hypothetical protein